MDQRHRASTAASAAEHRKKKKHLLPGGKVPRAKAVTGNIGGRDRDRTGDPLLAKKVEKVGAKH
jgi:hypothetical protein